MADLKKLAEDLTKLTVLEVNELKTILKDEYGIEPAAAVAAMAGPAAGGEAAAAEEAKSEYDVVLKDAGAQKVAVIKAVKDLVEQVKPVAPFHKFKLELPGEPLMGNWDVDRLQQAVGNLVDNAIKYSDDETTITLKIWETEGKACVSVHNVGAGIPKSQIDQLFRPFSRLKTPVLQDGTGLGLFITKSIIEAHRGELRLEELPEGQGTMFSFDLPR